ncbi:MAG TPA: asparagine synthetase B [candidate division Zixibacteria bacterium]|nr:asparagine synthetase B [candidate division Zixibacteria bacterium]
MRYVLFLSVGLLMLAAPSASAQKMLIYMDLEQRDHLKAYGVAFQALEQGFTIEWLLNYRGGSFVLDATEDRVRSCRLKGVSYAVISGAELARIFAEIEANNMDRVMLEKAPKIVVYTSPDQRPWDDAVTMALKYAEVPYKTIWDKEVLKGDLNKYDWLHLHHEDFTGQYSKFYSYHRMPWYQQRQATAEALARELGFPTVAEEKKAVARTIRSYVSNGGFLFAMCAATETLEVALAAQNTDIVAPEYDHTALDPNAQAKLDYSQTFAFENFTLQLNPLIGSFSNIDVNQVNAGKIPTGPFTLFDFSAKYDPVPTMLTQNHVNYVAGFYGLSTSFNRNVLKRTAIVLAEEAGTDRAKYIHGNFGKGTYTLYGGHDPEDEEHLVGDPPTNLALHKSSPGYRLILNNILFPAAKKKEKKT